MKSIILAHDVTTKESKTKSNVEEIDRTFQRLRMLSHPPLRSAEDTWTHEDMKNKMKLSLEILYGLHLIDEQARPIGLAGLAAHIPEIYPFNYYLTHLISTGKIQRILRPYSFLHQRRSGENFFNAEVEKRKAQQSLVDMLSHFIFQRAKAEGVRSLEKLKDNSLTSYNQDLERCRDNFCRLSGANFSSNVSLHRTVPIVSLRRNCSPWMSRLFSTMHWDGTLEECQMKDSQLYDLTSRLVSVLRKISVALQKLADNDADGYAAAFEDVADKFQMALESSSSSYR